MCDLIHAWRDWVAAGASGVLPGDEALLDRPDLTCHFSNWQEFVESHEWAAKSKRIHLGLTPTPYVGCLEHARIFILLLNPGFTPLNYFAEYQVPGQREIHLDCIAQNAANARRGFHDLQPDSSWRGGFQYWHGKLSALATQLTQSTGQSLPEAFDLIRRNLAIIELAPYHSATFGLPNSLLTQLRSVRLAQDYVRTVVAPRAINGDATIIVTRRAKLWNIEPSERVVVYKGSESRGAHLGPTTRGGAAILEALLGAAESG